MVRLLTALLLGMAPLGCSSSGDSGQGDGGAAEGAGVDPVVLLTRLSLDLRGTRPTVDEIEAVEADPAQAAASGDLWLAGPDFGARYVDLVRGVWATEVVEADHEDASYPVDDWLGTLEGLGREPLMIVQEIADQDLPYTELVTGDWTVIDEVLAGLYPTDYPADGTGWQVAHYTDDRPAAGVLSTNGFYWRYRSTLGNANRGRANQVRRILLCTDYLDMQIAGDRDLNLLDEEAVEDALRTSAACVGCHYSMDPLAAYFWGFYNHFEFSPAEQSAYHHERELWWEDYGGGIGPGYFGQPGDTLDDLGRQIASDPTFVECTVQRTFEQLLQRPISLDDTAALTAHRNAFLDAGLTLRGLVGSVIDDPRYLPLPTDDPSKTPWKVLSNEQLATSVEDLTGYRFEVDGDDLWRTDLFGMRTLAGGVGVDHDQPASLDPTPTRALVFERYSWAAASWVVAHDLASPDDARLLPGLSADWRPDSDADAMTAMVQRLYLRVLGQRVTADSDEVQRAMGLWTELYALDGDATVAWTGVVSHLLRHPDFLLY